MNNSRCRGGRENPSRGDQIVQVGDVIAVQMSHQNHRQKRRRHTGGDESHRHASTTIDQNILLRAFYQSRRPSAVCVGYRASRASQRDFH